MKVLVCDVGLEREFIGLDDEVVKELAEARSFSVPWSVSGFRNVVEGSSELYPVVGVNGVLGDGEIRIFVILKSGYALGIRSVIGYEDLREELEIPEDLREYFKGAYKYGDGVVYILGEDGVKNLPKVDIPDRKRVSGVKDEHLDVEESWEFLVLHIGDEKYAVKKEDISEISDPSKVNIMDMGNLYGFTRSSGRIVAVISKWKIDPKWIVVLKDVAVPCESFETMSSELLDADGKEFVIFEGEQIDVLSEEELKRWI